MDLDTKVRRENLEPIGTVELKQRTPYIVLRLRVNRDKERIDVKLTHYDKIV